MVSYNYIVLLGKFFCKLTISNFLYIVIIVILASVTIVGTFGDNGIIKKAELARDLASNSTIKEAEEMNAMVDEYANIMSGGENPGPGPEEDKTPPTVEIVVGEITETSIAITANATDDSGEIAKYVYHINGKEPHVAGKTVQDPPDQRLLPGHAGQLPVRTVIKVGPYQQDDAEDGMGHVGVIEHHAGRHAENDGQDSNDVRMNSKVIEELCPPQPEGASEMNVEPLFGVL